MGLPALMRDLGVDPDLLFRDAGFDPAQFDDPDVRIPYAAGSRLYARCVEASRREDFGLLVAQHASPSALGMAGYMLRTAPDVRTALHGLVQHFDLHDEGGVPFVTTTKNVTLFGFAIHESDVAASAEIYDQAIAIACAIMRSLCGPDWRPSEVLLSRRPPRNAAPWRRYFQAPLRFDADQSAIAFATRWLDHPLPGADALLHRHLEMEAAALRAQRAPNRLADLHALLRGLLAARKVSVVEVARQLNVHVRTLHRRLRKEGTTFRHELEQVRYTAARQLLGESTMSIVQIAAALEYADASAFSRAFKRWAGATPAQWRTRRKRRGRGTGNPPRAAHRKPGGRR